MHFGHVSEATDISLSEREVERGGWEGEREGEREGWRRDGRRENGRKRVSLYFSHVYKRTVTGYVCVCVCVCVACIVRGEKANLVSGMKCGGRGRCSPTQPLQNRASQRKSPTSDATPYLADSCGPPRQP